MKIHSRYKQLPPTIPPNPGLGYKFNFVVNRSRALLSDYMSDRRWRSRKKREATSDTLVEEIPVVALVRHYRQACASLTTPLLPSLL